MNGIREWEIALRFNFKFHLKKEITAKTLRRKEIACKAQRLHRLLLAAVARGLNLFLRLGVLAVNLSLRICVKS
jgi:hypothetical protein